MQFCIPLFVFFVMKIIAKGKSVVIFICEYYQKCVNMKLDFVIIKSKNIFLTQKTIKNQDMCQKIRGNIKKL